MANRSHHRLTAKQVVHASGPAKLADGGGLYLRIDKDGAKQWIFRYSRPGGQRAEMGLGAAGTGRVSLEVARKKAAEARALLDAGRDPIVVRKEARIAAPIIPTFAEFADTFVDEIESEFRNEKHRAQWKMTLGDAYCAAIRKKPIDQISSEDLLKVLQPVWLTKSETASRLRGRIERVMDAAKARGLRTGENPAIWRGGLKAALPKRQKLQRGHHEALSYRNIPAFIENLRTQEVLTARALEFLILSASRSGEVRNAQWSEFDLAEKIWTIPAERMKAARLHRVPLTDRMLEILQEQMALARGRESLVFPGQIENRPLSDMTMSKLLKRMEVKSGNDKVVTVHGFRSSFRDWVGEATTFQREVAEAALAHTVGDATERAYRRGDALEKRRKLMEAWEKFCGCA